MGYIKSLTGGGGFEFINFMGKMLSINYSNDFKIKFKINAILLIVQPIMIAIRSFSFIFREPRLFDTPNSMGFSISHSEQGKSSNSLLKYDTISDRVSIMFGRRFDWPDYFFINYDLSIRKTDYNGGMPISELIDDFDESIIVQISTLGYASRKGVQFHKCEFLGTVEIDLNFIKKDLSFYGPQHFLDHCSY